VPEPSLLEISSASKHFKGLEALSNVSMRIVAGGIYGLIGPNGAGKTTLFNVISGVSPATAGTVRFNGRDITRTRAHEIARLGIARTYQLVRPFHELSAIENVEVGILFGRERGERRRAARLVEASRYLEEVGLSHKASDSVVELNLGERKRLEIAKALAARPQLVLFDEVLAGLNPTETIQAINLFHRIRQLGATILMIEHNMQAIMRTCNHIFVLHHGILIAEGAPEAILADAKVIEAYLGRRDLKLDRQRKARMHASG